MGRKERFSKTMSNSINLSRKKHDFIIGVILKDQTTFGHYHANSFNMFEEELKTLTTQLLSLLIISRGIDIE